MSGFISRTAFIAARHIADGLHANGTEQTNDRPLDTKAVQAPHVDPAHGEGNAPRALCQTQHGPDDTLAPAMRRRPTCPTRLSTAAGAATGNRRPGPLPCKSPTDGFHGRGYPCRGFVFIPERYGASARARPASAGSLDLLSLNNWPAPTRARGWPFHTCEAPHDRTDARRQGL